MSSCLVCIQSSTHPKYIVLDADPIRTEDLPKTTETLAAFYLRVVNEDTWPPLENDFINLALIKDQSSWRTTVDGSVDAIVCKKRTLAYSELFDLQQQTKDSTDLSDRSGVFLLQGRPGSGKTTLMTKLSRDWANKTILKSKLFFLVYLRRLNSQKSISLMSIIHQACPVFDEDFCYKLESHINRTSGKGMVFALDGLDEYSPHISDSNADGFLTSEDFIFMLIKGQKLPHAMVVVTSRPAACTNIRIYATKAIEVLGFLQKQVFEYMQCYFKNNAQKAEKIITHLKQRPNLMNICYLPLHCSMLAFLYEEDTILPNTETDFYKHFTLSTLHRSIRKRQGKVLQMSLFHHLPHDDKVLFDKVCKLAFDATVGKKQVFTLSDLSGLEDALFKPNCTGNDESTLGLVVIDRYFMKYGLDETYTFLHLTFQEYLSAVHIVSLSECEILSKIESLCCERHLMMVWRFMCGMMDFSSASSVKAFEALMDGCKSLVETDVVLFQIHCCYESQHSLPCSHMVKSQNGCLTFIDINLSPIDCTAIGYVINKADIKFTHVTFENCYLSTEGAVTFLQQTGEHPLSLRLCG